MKKEAFEKLSAKEQADYVNAELAAGVKMQELNERFQVGKNYLSRHFANVGYSYDRQKKIYYQESQEQLQGQIDIAEVTTESSNQVVPATKEMQKNMVEIAQNSTEILQMLEWYRMQQSGKVVDGLHINYDKFEGDTQARSIKLYQNIRERLAEFLEKHSNFKLQDVANQAFLEFLEKYD